MTIEEYLRAEIQRGVIDFTLRVHDRGVEGLTFYIHPESRDGMTRDFLVKGGEVTPSSFVTYGE